jgi:hypothetical protein
MAGIFLTITDIQNLLSVHYDTAVKLHVAARDALKKKTKYITIREFCKSEDMDFEEVWRFLRGDEPYEKKRKPEK